MKHFFRRSAVPAIILFLMAALIIISFGCAQKAGKAKEEPKEIKIGAILCLTGSGAAYGEDSQRGIQLAVEEINKSGGIKGIPIKLIVEDDQTNPTSSASATAKLISQEKVQVIIGAVTSSSMLADAPIAEKAKVIMLSPGASSPKVTAAGDYIFRNWISDALEGKAMADYLYNDEKVRKAAILYINNDYGTGLKEVFNQHFKALGGEITDIESNNQDDTDFRTQLTKIIASGPDRIYLPGYYKEMALILKQAKEVRNTIPFRSVVTFEEPELLKLAKSEAEGVIYSSPFYNPEENNDNVVKFVASFKREYNREPGIFAAHGYDAIMIIAKVLRKCDQCSSELIKNELYKTQNFPGVSGLTTFDKNGDVIKPVAIKQVKNGKCILLNTVSGMQ
jgi:branched-chain amino acid transport system substrate-binding protein